jgi:hypothetical protein
VDGEILQTSLAVFSLICVYHKAEVTFLFLDSSDDCFSSGLEEGSSPKVAVCIVIVEHGAWFK